MVVGNQDSRSHNRTGLLHPVLSGQSRAANERSTRAGEEV
jgi:hypothetical protein